jgi:hypothetical protein
VDVQGYSVYNNIILCTETEHLLNDLNGQSKYDVKCPTLPFSLKKKLLSGSGIPVLTVPVRTSAWKNAR